MPPNKVSLPVPTIKRSSRSEPVSVVAVPILIPLVESLVLILIAPAAVAKIPPEVPVEFN